MKRAKFRVYEDKAGEWRWRLLAANGRVIADSGEGYVSRTGANRAVETLRQTALVAQTPEQSEPEVVVINPSIDVALPTRKPH